MERKKKNKEEKTIEIEVTDNFYKLSNSKARYVLMRGSTRSGKSIAIIQYILNLCINRENTKIVVGVETISRAKTSLLKDIEEWIFNFGLNNVVSINKSDFVYSFKNGSSINIIPADKPSKWHGVKADIFWFNEATHIEYDVFEQAKMRLPSPKEGEDSIYKFILDFNPTNPYSWVRELENSDLPGGVDTFVSTYKDNPFLNELQILTIENLKNENHNKWLIYAQGEYGEVEGAIFRNWQIVDSFPNCDFAFGMDFGYTNDPTTIVKVGKYNNEIYLEEILYQTGMTNNDIISFIKDNSLDGYEFIADSAEPKSIEEIRLGGIKNIRGAIKGPNSIINGIDVMLRYKLNIVKGSRNLIDEVINYSWKKNKVNGEFFNVPNSGWDHCLDSARYLIFEKYGIKSTGSNIVFRTIKR